MVYSIDENREVYGVGQSCTVLLIAPSTYYEQKEQHVLPEHAPLRVRRDIFLGEEIQQLQDENFQV